jgi:hypothetical protein
VKESAWGDDVEGEVKTFSVTSSKALMKLILILLFPVLALVDSASSLTGKTPR